MNWKLRVFFIILAAIFVFTAVQNSFAKDKSTKGQKVWSARATGNEYLIGSGDLLRIVTWKEPDFSLENILVRIDGKITFPLLNDVQAAGLTPLDLKRDLETKLKAYVSTPVVTVTVVDPSSKRFYVLGEVLRTGEYPLNKHLTVLQAFALAGGFTEWASKKEIILLRTEGGKETIHRINYKDIVKGQNLNQNLKLRADDTIIVP